MALTFNYNVLKYPIKSKEIHLKSIMDIKKQWHLKHKDTFKTLSTELWSPSNLLFLIIQNVTCMKRDINIKCSLVELKFKQSLHFL
jgi:hypothetical protein